jgi:(2Fe-2S) ferredoxin
MEKLNSWDELKKYRADTKGETSLLSDESDRIVLAVGEATCGIAAGAKKMADVMQAEIDRLELKNVSIIATGCYGFCYAEPMVEVRVSGKPSVYYGYLTEDVAKSIITKHIVQNEPIEANILRTEVLIP